MPDEKRDELDESRMPLWEHLDELRRCLIRSLLAFLVGLVATYNFCEPVIDFLERPLLQILPPGEQNLYFTGVADKFIVYFKVACLAALALTSPVLLHQAWSFISPGLRPQERRFALPFMLFGTLTFVGGLAFAYYLVIPYGYRFLIEFGSPNDKPLITLTAYFDLTLKLMLSMGLIFQMPVLMVLLGKFGIIKAALLGRYRRHAMLGIAVSAAILTPTPDAFTMLIVMVPLYLLYEVSIVAVRFVEKKEVSA